MSTHPVPLNELATLVQNAVQQALAKHGAVPIDKLWFGFVAPEALANQKIASEVATQIGHLSGAHVTPLVATESLPPAATGAHTEALIKPGHIIGLVYNPKLAK